MVVSLLALWLGSGFDELGFGLFLVRFGGCSWLVMEIKLGCFSLLVLERSWREMYYQIYMM